MSKGASPGRAAIEGIAHSRLIKIGPGDNPCWIWQASLTNAGYPRKRWFNRELSARRWVYAMLLGVIPTTRVLEAKCGDRLCVNPTHMRLVRMTDAQQAGESATLVPGDAGDMRLRLADPRCKGRTYLTNMISSVAEEYGITRDYAQVIMGNRQHVDPGLPVGIRNIIQHYREHPPCATTSSQSTTPAPANAPTTAATPRTISPPRSTRPAIAQAPQAGASTSCANG